jgi:leader peptidase (prepilin peptidase)/N-methyltransferase
MIDLLDHLDANTLQVLAVAYWLTLVFVVGAAIGSFINVAATRLPLEKSLLWPSSRCSTCLKPIRWYDNLPLVSYLWLRGRCRSCGQRFSSRYFWVELATALGFVGLFYAEVLVNLHGWPGVFLPLPPWPWIVGFGYHAILFSFLMVASVSDLQTREIPLPLTLTGAAIGLVGAVLMPWPWPQTAVAAGPVPPGPMAFQVHEIKQGIYPWPFWGPLPGPFTPGGNWQTGLATGLAGALAGSLMLRAVGFLFGAGLGKEAMGLGDADLMMMAGAFLGWQVVVLGFFLSAFPALVFGVIRRIVYRDNALPFGPSLSAGVLGTYLAWGILGPAVQQVFFHGIMMIFLAVAGASLLFGMAFMIRLMRA